MSIIYLTVPPQSTDGNDGDFCIDTATNTIYGPRASGVWPSARLLLSLPGVIGPVEDSIIARITANRKAALQAISIANGYTFTPTMVEEERTELDFAKVPFIRILRLAGDVEADANFSDETDIAYCVSLYDIVSDTGIDPITQALRQETTYQHRNILADITKAWMQDIYCGQLAESTRADKWSDGIGEGKTAGGGTIVFYCAMNIFIVTARINSRDPYSLA